MSEHYFTPIRTGANNSADTFNNPFRQIDSVVYTHYRTLLNAIDTLLLNDGTGNAEVLAARNRIRYLVDHPPDVLGDTVELVGRNQIYVDAFYGGTVLPGDTADTAAIKAALAVTSPGDVVVFTAGKTYEVPVTLTIGTSDVTLWGYGATIDATGLDNETGSSDPPNPTIYALNKSNVRVIGLTLMGPPVEGSINLIGTTANSTGIFFQACTHCMVRDCYIEGYFRGGIYAWGNNHSIVGNHLHHVRYRPPEMGSIFLSGNTGSTVVGNVITGVWGSGVAAQNSYRCTIQGNFIEGEDWTDSEWLEVQSMGIACYNVKNFSIDGNVIHRITDEGIVLVTGSNTTDASFNTISDNVMYNCHLRGVNVRAITGNAPGHDAFDHITQYNTITGNVVIIDDDVPGGAPMDCAYMVECDTLVAANNFAVGNQFNNNIAVGINNTITKGFYSTGAQITRTQVVGNLFRNCVTGIHIVAPESLVEGNAVYDTTSAGIALGGATSNSLVEGNLVMGSAGDSIQLSGAMLRTIIRDNHLDKKVTTTGATGSSWWIGDNTRSDIATHGAGTLSGGIATVSNAAFSTANSEAVVQVWRRTNATTPANNGALFVSLLDQANNLIQVKSTNASDDSGFWWKLIR